MQILLLGYKIKNAIQKSTTPEAKNFRDFHSQIQFSLNKLHFQLKKLKKGPTFHRRLRRRQNFSQNFRKPRAFGARTPLLGAFGPQKWEYPPPSRKKIGRRHEKIAQNRVFTVVNAMIIKLQMSYDLSKSYKK